VVGGRQSNGRPHSPLVPEYFRRNQSFPFLHFFATRRESRGNGTSVPSSFFLISQLHIDESFRRVFPCSLFLVFRKVGCEIFLIDLHCSSLVLKYCSSRIRSLPFDSSFALVDSRPHSSRGVRLFIFSPFSPKDGDRLPLPGKAVVRNLYPPIVLDLFHCTRHPGKMSEVRLPPFNHPSKSPASARLWLLPPKVSLPGHQAPFLPPKRAIWRPVFLLFSSSQ